MQFDSGGGGDNDNYKRLLKLHGQEGWVTWVGRPAPYYSACPIGLWEFSLALM